MFKRPHSVLNVYMLNIDSPSILSLIELCVQWFSIHQYFLSRLHFTLKMGDHLCQSSLKSHKLDKQSRKMRNNQNGEIIVLWWISMGGRLSNMGDWRLPMFLYLKITKTGQKPRKMEKNQHGEVIVLW